MNFTLRPWRETDAPAIVPYADDPLVAQNLRDAFPNPYTLADAEYFVKACMEHEGQGQLCHAITVDGQAVGSVSFSWEMMCTAEARSWATGWAAPSGGRGS